MKDLFATFAEKPDRQGTQLREKILQSLAKAQEWEFSVRRDLPKGITVNNGTKDMAHDLPDDKSAKLVFSSCSMYFHRETIWSWP